MSGRLWHGGCPGLKPGDLLLPPSETGFVHPFTQYFGVTPQQLGMEADRNRADRVYLTSSRDLASAYAAAWEMARCGDRPGVLYTAEPVGQLEDDPDLPGISWQCERARVVKIYDAAVRMSLRRFDRIMTSVIGIGS